MKVKYIIALLLIGWIVMIVGALYKLTHKPGADLVLTIGTGIKVVAIFLGIVKLFTSKKFRNFLDS